MICFNNEICENAKICGAHAHPGSFHDFELGEALGKAQTDKMFVNSTASDSKFDSKLFSSILYYKYQVGSSKISILMTTNYFAFMLSTSWLLNTGWQPNAGWVLISGLHIIKTVINRFKRNFFAADFTVSYKEER